MQLIASLAAGMVGAENGVARIYRRGTSTRATVYGDFEASIADSSGDDIALDSTGGAVVYVNELVQVRVFDSLGELVRDFVSGEGAYAVEVISSSFTGTNYDSGRRAVSEPTTAGAIFDLWMTSAGATDWEVLFTGASTPLKDALGSIYGMFFNVKSPEFGAVGDGAEDDTASWQAAHDAADAAGGGIVVAPPGDYIISSELDWKTRIHLLCMPGTVIIRQKSANVSHFGINGSVVAPAVSAGTPTYFIGAALGSTITNTATQFTVGHGNADEVIVDSFRFNASAECTGASLVVGSSTGRVQVRNSEATARASTTLFYDTRSPTDTGVMMIDNCVIKDWAGAYGGVMVQSSGNELRVTRTRFGYQGTSGTSIAIYLAGATYPLTVSDCRFIVLSGGSTRYAVQLYANMLVSVDDSNRFPSAATLNRYYQAATTDIASERSYLALQAHLALTSSSSSIAFGANEGVYRAMMLTSNYAAGAVTITMPPFYYYGQPLSIALRNDSGSAWGTSVAITDWAGAGTAYNTVAAAVALDAGKIVSFNLVAVSQDGVARWMQMGEFSAPFTI